MTVYVVERWGVNQQGCAGVFESLDKAIEVAKSNIQLEKDAWHFYVVVAVSVNTAHAVHDNSLPTWPEIYAIKWGGGYYNREKRDLEECFNGEDFQPVGLDRNPVENQP
jgi:hypothetical protein